MPRAPRSKNRNGLPDPRRRAELQELAAQRVKQQRSTRITLRLADGDPLYVALVASSIEPSATLAEAIVSNLGWLNVATVARLRRPNGTGEALHEISVRVHWRHAERFVLAANASGLSNCLAAEVLLRGSLLGDPNIEF